MEQATAAEVRAFGRENDYPVRDRGPLPKDLIRHYDRVHRPLGKFYSRRSTARRQGGGVARQVMDLHRRQLLHEGQLKELFDDVRMIIANYKALDGTVRLLMSEWGIPPTR